MTVLDDFGKRVSQERREKSVREWRDILRKEIAEEMGTSAATYGRWEAGLVMPDDAMLVKLAAYFGVTPAWLRYGQEPRALPSTEKLKRPAEATEGRGKRRA